jgi:hypothetical protein
METLGIAVVFVVMLAAPCLIAVRSSRQADVLDASDAPEPVQAAMAADLNDVLDRPLTLAEMAMRAEGDALYAQEMAREAQRAALAAMAHAARLRADAAIEAAKAAEEAIRAAQPNYLPADHPSLDFPRSRQRRVAA